MYRIKIEEELLSVTVETRFGGGVLDARLTSHYACPKCHETLKFMALFENVDDCRMAFQNMETDYTMKAEVVGQFIVGTTGRGGHSKRSTPYYSIGFQCNRVQFMETQRELAREIWARFQQQYGDIDWTKMEPMPRPRGRLDVTQLDGIDLVEDEIESGNKPILVIDSLYLRSPGDLIIGGWDTKEDFDLWHEKIRKAPQIFLQRIYV